MVTVMLYRVPLIQVAGNGTLYLLIQDQDNFDCLNQCEQYYQTSFSSCKDEHSVPLKMEEIKKIANKIVNCDPN